ncbi:hypothetical protein Tco_0260245, partial [Tanacetum coccineum]
KDAMDKEVAENVKDHKKKQYSDDDEDDDDDEGPSAGSNQGRSTKREKDLILPLLGQLNLLRKLMTKITDTREAGVDSSMHRSDAESKHSEQSSDDISKQDGGNDSDMEDTDNAHIPKVSTTTWFKPIPESERPATPEPEWTIPPNDFPEPEHNWANAYAIAYKVPEENKLQRKTYDIGLDEMNALSLLTNKVDLCNHEVIRIPQNLNEQLPLGGPPVRFKKCSNHLHPRRQDQYSNSSSYIWRISNPGDSESLWRVLQLLGIESYGTIPNDPAITGANLQPGTNPLVSVEVLSTGINPTIGSSHEVSLSTEGDILKMEMEMEIPSSGDVK